MLKDKGHKTAIFITWNYAAGKEMLEGFKEAFEKQGGKLVRELLLPFPQVEFQALLTEAAAIRPDAVVAFFAGGGAAKFLRDYAAAGLKGRIPLYGSGFLTDGVLEAVGDAAEGVETTLHYGDGLSITRATTRSASPTSGPTGPRRTSTPCRATTRPSCSPGPRRRERRRLPQERADRGDGESQDRQPARRLDHVQGPQPGAGLLPAQGQSARKT